MRNVKVRRGGVRRRSQPVVEGLESRQLLSAVVANEYPFSPNHLPDTPTGIVAGPDGNLWFLENSPSIDGAGDNTAGSVGEINPTTGAVKMFDIPAIGLPQPTGGSTSGTTGASHISRVQGITVGSDGNIWFGIDGPNWSGLASINPTTHAIRDYPVSSGSVGSLAATPGGNIWYTDETKSAIGVFNLATHTATEYPLTQSTSVPSAITVGPDGNLWFVETFANKVGMINPTTHAITEFATPTANSRPNSIVAGFDGNMWFTEQGMGIPSAAIGMVNLSMSDAITEIPLSSTSHPLALTAGSDGNLYFTEVTSNGQTDPNGIVSFNPRTHAVVESDIPASNPLPVSIDFPNGQYELSSSPEPLAVGPDGNLWIEDAGRIDHAALVEAGTGAITSNVFQSLFTDSPSFTTPLAGRTVYLDLQGDGKFDAGDPTALTDANGSYVFSGLAPGYYTVRLQTYPGENLVGPASTGEFVTVTDGGVAQPATIGVLPGSSILPLTTTSNPFGTNNPDLATAEVNGLYNSILGRAPDASGGAAAVAYLRSGGAIETLAKDLLGSIEYDSDVVASYYKNFLDRAGTADEIKAWVSLMQGGLLQEQMAAKFFDSTEYTGLHIVDSDFIQSLYTNILGRQASAAEVAGWESNLAWPTNPVSNPQGPQAQRTPDFALRPQMVQIVLRSMEAATRAIEGLDGVFNGRPQLNINEDKADIGDLYYGNPQLITAIYHAISTDFVNRAALTVKIPPPPQEA
jgi:streptogramin lyase